MKKNLILIIVIGLLISCNQKKQTEVKKAEIVPEINHKAKGREISTISQNELLATVGSALKKGGVTYAVEYCNLKAVPVIDSLSKNFNCIISRISTKNRNSENGLKNDLDITVWNKFEKTISNTLLPDTVIKINNQSVYYKAIAITMPTCLSCHGDPESYIQPNTLKKIDKLYPEDKAKNYKMNELRGLWKIEFTSIK